MPTITDEQIALLADVGQASAIGTIEGHKQRDLDALVAEGLVERLFNNSTSSCSYRLTGKGEQFLTQRGAGLNEA